MPIEEKTKIVGELALAFTLSDMMIVGASCKKTAEMTHETTSLRVDIERTESLLGIGTPSSPHGEPTSFYNWKCNLDYAETMFKEDLLEEFTKIGVSREEASSIVDDLFWRIVLQNLWRNIPAAFYNYNMSKVSQVTELAKVLDARIENLRCLQQLSDDLVAQAEQLNENKITLQLELAIMGSGRGSTTRVTELQESIRTLESTDLPCTKQRLAQRKALEGQYAAAYQERVINTETLSSQEDWQRVFSHLEPKAAEAHKKRRNEEAKATAIYTQYPNYEQIVVTLRSPSEFRVRLVRNSAPKHVLVISCCLNGGKVLVTNVADSLQEQVLEEICQEDASEVIFNQIMASMMGYFPPAWFFESMEMMPESIDLLLRYLAWSTQQGLIAKPLTTNPALDRSENVPKKDTLTALLDHPEKCALLLEKASSEQLEQLNAIFSVNNREEEWVTFTGLNSSCSQKNIDHFLKVLSAISLQKDKNAPRIFNSMFDKGEQLTAFLTKLSYSQFQIFITICGQVPYPQQHGEVSDSLSYQHWLFARIQQENIFYKDILLREVIVNLLRKVLEQYCKGIAELQNCAALAELRTYFNFKPIDFTRSLHHQVGSDYLSIYFDLVSLDDKASVDFLLQILTKCGLLDCRTIAAPTFDASTSQQRKRLLQKLTEHGREEVFRNFYQNKKIFTTPEEIFLNEFDLCMMDNECNFTEKLAAYEAYKQAVQGDVPSSARAKDLCVKFEDLQKNREQQCNNCLSALNTVLNDIAQGIDPQFLTQELTTDSTQEGKEILLVSSCKLVLQNEIKQHLLVETLLELFDLELYESSTSLLTILRDCSLRFASSLTPDDLAIITQVIYESFMQSLRSEDPEMELSEMVTHLHAQYITHARGHRYSYSAIYSASDSVMGSRSRATSMDDPITAPSSNQTPPRSSHRNTPPDTTPASTEHTPGPGSFTDRKAQTSPRKTLPPTVPGLPGTGQASQPRSRRHLGALLTQSACDLSDDDSSPRGRAPFQSIPNSTASDMGDLSFDASCDGESFELPGVHQDTCQDALRKMPTEQTYAALPPQDSRMAEGWLEDRRAATTKKVAVPPMVALGMEHVRRTLNHTSLDVSASSRAPSQELLGRLLAAPPQEEPIGAAPAPGQSPGQSPG